MSDSDFDPKLKSEFEQLAYRSNEATGTVDVKVTSVRRDYDGDSVEVTFDPPIGNLFTQKMDLPMTASDETGFTDLLKQCGTNLDEPDKIVGQYVPFFRVKDEWVYAGARPSRTVSDRIASVRNRHWVALTETGLKIVLAIIFLPLTTLIALAMYSRGELDHREQAAGDVAILVLFSFIWLFPAVGVVGVLT